VRFGWFEACLIGLASYGAASACSSTSSHSVGNSPDTGAGRGGTGGGGTGAASGRGGADGSGGASGSGAGVSGSGGVSGSAGESGSSGVSGSGGAGGSEGGDASAGSSGTAGTSGAAGSGGNAGTSGTAGTTGASGRGGTTGSAGTNGASGRGGTAGTNGASGSSGSAGTGGAPMDSGPQRWCTTQARPAGVAAADYQCLDFDNGLPPTATWAPTLSGQGSRSITTARASSLPQSLITSLGSATSAGTPQRATLEWHNVGSTGVSSVSIAADLNPVNFAGVAPAWTGSINLLCASFGSGNTCFSYTRGADLSFADAYTGYFIEHTYSGGPATRYQCQVTGNLVVNLWTRVELRLTRSPANIQVFIGGANAGQCSGSYLDDTATDISFGMRSFPEAQNWTVYYDNVVATVRR
jgi:hypothetical protein